jgi:hypothetical protein
MKFEGPKNHPANPERQKAHELSGEEKDLLNSERDRIVALLEANSVNPDEFAIMTLKNTSGALSVDFHVRESHYEGNSRVASESIKLRQILELEGVKFRGMGNTTSIEVER